jgi:hypothetical protein
MLRSPEIQLEAKRDFRLQSSACAAILELPDMFHNISYANPRSPWQAARGKNICL